MKVRFVTSGRERGTRGLMCLKYSTFLANLSLTSIHGKLVVENKNKKLTQKIKIIQRILHLLEVCGQENPSLQAGNGKSKNKERKS